MRIFASKTMAIPLILLMLVAMPNVLMAEDNVVSHPIIMGGFSEFGNIEKGIFNGTKDISIEYRDEWIDHIGLYFIKNYTVNGQWHLSTGLAGSFQFRKPESAGAQWFNSQTKGFWGAPFGNVVYDFFNGENSLSLGAGNFGYKYNSNAHNLGEYLFRSRPYPNYVYTGGYKIVNDATGYFSGFKSSLKMGGFYADAFFLSEKSSAPFFDWSPALVTGLKGGDGLFHIGGGFKWKSLIIMDEDKTQNEARSNSYFTVDNIDYVGNSQYYQARYRKAISPTDSLYWRGLGDSATSIYNRIYNESNPDPRIKYFTSEGISVMSFFNFDIKKLFGDPSVFGSEDLKISIEAIVLGVQDYPVYYTDIMQRIPVMLGFNFPAFGYLDLIGIQAEYWDNPHLNSLFTVAENSENIPHEPATNHDINFTDRYFMDEIINEKWKWSVLAIKRVGSLSIRGQAGQDHLTMVGLDFWGPNWELTEITPLNKHWYWMIQLGWDL